MLPRTRGYTKRSSYNSTTRHTPLSHCPQPVGYTTCIALYSMRVNYTYNSPPISNKARKAKAQDPGKRTKRKGAQSAQKKTIYIFIFFYFSFSDFFAPRAKKSPLGRKNLPACENFAPRAKKSPRCAKAPEAPAVSYIYIILFFIILSVKNTRYLVKITRDLVKITRCLVKITRCSVPGPSVPVYKGV